MIIIMPLIITLKIIGYAIGISIICILYSLYYKLVKNIIKHIEDIDTRNNIIFGLFKSLLLISIYIAPIIMISLMLD